MQFDSIYYFSLDFYSCDDDDHDDDIYIHQHRLPEQTQQRKGKNITQRARERDKAYTDEE